MMAIPERIAILITDAAGSPIANTFATVQIKMPRKNDHRVWVGPTDAHGRVTVTRDSLFEEARKDTQFFVMDYLDPAEAGGEFVVTAVTCEDLERAIRVYEEFKEHFPFRPGWLDQIVAAHGVMQYASEPTARVEKPSHPVV